jgi:hypothetical protein
MISPMPASTRVHAPNSLHRMRSYAWLNTLPKDIGTPNRCAAAIRHSRESGNPVTFFLSSVAHKKRRWIPAFAGMT